MPFEDLIGNARAAAMLAAGAHDDALSHALLLVGPPSVGKTTLALALASELLVGGAWPGPPDAHPDLWLEDGGAERVGIGRVRAGAGEREERSLQDFLSLHSYAGGRRVAVLARADRLTLEAANCILRTVEEPPSRTHIILCASHPERLPNTLVSRCQSIGLAPVPRAEIVTWLTRRRAVPPELARAAAMLAGGRPGRALRLATDAEALRVDMGALDAFLGVAGQGTAGTIRTADLLAPPTGAEGRERSLAQLAVWAEFIRDAICRALGAGELNSWTEYLPALEAWAQLPVWRLVDMLADCVRAADELDRNANARLCYEVLLLRIFGTDHPAPALAGRTPPAAPAIGAAPAPRPPALSGYS